MFNISGSSLSPGGIIWSGNFYGRTGCDPTTGVCQNATCVGAAGGLACGPGTGPSPGTNTLAELTFQAYPATDFYDVSIINGANFAVQFGPSNVRDLHVERVLLRHRRQRHRAERRFPGRVRRPSPACPPRTGR